MSNLNDKATTSVVQADGKLVVVGQNAQSGDMLAIRFTAAGALDTSFGGDGIVEVDFGGGTTSIANDAQVQDDGKLVLVGTVMGGVNDDVGVARLNTNGAPDPTFDGPGGSGNGAFVLDYSGNDIGSAVDIDASSKILVGGSQNGESDPAVWRLSTTGTLDTGFDTDGKTDFSGFGGDPANGMRVTAIFVQNNNKIVYSGVNGGALVAVRTNSDGSGDTAFSGDGYAAAPVQGTTDEAFAAVATSGGVVTIAGRANGANADIVAARFTNNGNLDTSFDTDGVVKTDSGSATDVANDAMLLSDGRLLVAGDNGTNTLLVQYTTSGALDTSFGSNGIATIDASGAGLADRTNGIDLQPNGLIVLASEVGTASNGDDPAVLRLQGSTADVSITASAPLPVAPLIAHQTGTPITVTATVTNSGVLTQTGTTVTATGPLVGAAAAGTVTAMTTTGGGTCTTAPAVCSLGNLAQGATATVTLTYTPTLSGTHTLSLAVSGTSVDSGPANDSTSVSYLVKQLMTLGPPTETATLNGKVRKCGTTLKKACVDKLAAKAFFKGTLAPGASAVAGRPIVIKFFKKSGSKYKLAKKVTVKLNKKKAWTYTRAAKALGKGTYRVNATTAANATTTAATSKFRYFIVK